MNAPKQATWVVAIVLAVVAVVQEYLFDMNLGAYTFYLMIASVALLALGSKVKGL
ncbi:MAG: hypothetical protein KTR29_20090 [Rhodothermaceae bacterium]|nr:hypothetical protein [Rhodothermaceae bacterium]